MSVQEKKDISIAKLNVDVENFRIGEFNTSREAYKAMIKEEGDDLINLAEDIVERGLSPTERFIVMPDSDESGSFIVLEGNRRLTILKILETPKLASGTEAEAEFSRLSKRYLQGGTIQKLECVIFPDKETALPWIERKHTTLEGRGLSAWGAPAKARAEAFRGKVRPSKAVLDFLREKDLIPNSLEENLRRRTTNIDRVFQMPYVKEALGINIAKDGAVTFDNGKDGAGGRLMLKMVKQLADKDFNVNNIRSAKQREKFIDGFSSEAVTRDEVGSTGTSKGSSTRKRRSTLERKSLALKGNAYSLNIREPRLNSLYIEALNLKTERLPNCGAILTRVFLELGTEHYLTKSKVPLPDSYTKKGKTKWSDIGIRLKDKIQIALNTMDPSKNERELTYARRGLSDDDYIHSVTTLHQYIHNLNMDASPSEVKRAWERWQPYFARIFAIVK